MLNAHSSVVAPNMTSWLKLVRMVMTIIRAITANNILLTEPEVDL